MKKTMATLLTGMLLGATLLGTVSAAESKLNIVADYLSIKYIFNGKEKQPSNKSNQYYNGKEYVPAGFVYNGTTYVPLRFLSESLGKEVYPQWQNGVMEIVVNDKSSAQLTPLSKIALWGGGNGLGLGFTPWPEGRKLNDGRVYKDGFIFSSKTNSQVSAKYSLNAEYKTLSGLFGWSEGDDVREANEFNLQILGDDKVLYSASINGLSTPIKLDTDITGVRVLEVKGSKLTAGNPGFVDVMLGK